MSRLGRLLAMVGVGLVAVAGVTGVLAGAGGGLFNGDSDGPPASAQPAGVVTPDQLVAASSVGSEGGDRVEVVGDVLTCPSGKEVRSKYEEHDGKFEVKGTLVSLDDTTVVVAGPSGDVTAAVAGDAKVKGDPQPGDIVEVEGWVQEDGSFLAREIKKECEDEHKVEVVGDVLTCPSGKEVRSKYKEHDGKFEVKGTLVSLDDTTVVVAGPSGDVTAAVAGDAEVKGDPQPGDIVEVEGWVQEDGSFLAGEIKNECEDEHENEVVGDVLTCPSGKQVRSKFEQHDGKFEVKGTLVSLDDTTVVVAGPSGDVTAAVAGDAKVKGDPQPGDIVEVEGWVQEDGSFLAREIENECEDEHEHEVVGDVLTCPSGKEVRSKYEEHDGKFEVKGTLVSLDGTTVVVAGPGGDVTAAVAGDAKVKGDPQPGDIVEVEGRVQEDGSFLAREIENECEDEHEDDHDGGHDDDHHNSHHDDHDDDDHDHDDDD